LFGAKLMNVGYLNGDELPKRVKHAYFARPPSKDANGCVAVRGHDYHAEEKVKRDKELHLNGLDQNHI
jgi:hypothetical protein